MPEPAQCAQSLFDPDAIDEARAGYGQRVAEVPLRLARVAAPVPAPAGDLSINATWEPRQAGAPSRSDQAGWGADRRTIALLMPYLDPQGAHGLGAVDPCDVFSMSRYLRHLVGRFFQSFGADPYYLSHPSSHHCLERGDCPFLTTP